MGRSADTQTGVKDALDQLKLSANECARFEDAFKDKDFVHLFEEYAKEIQDPAARAETSAYLQQLEQQGQLESVYGKGTRLITPNAEFVVKTAQASGEKVFINMCSSDQVRNWHVCQL